MASVRRSRYVSRLKRKRGNINMNNCQFTGRLTADPELRKAQSGRLYLSFTIAVDRIGKDEPADFIRCKVFGQPAEFMAQYTSKGDVIGVAGSLRIDSYEKDGRKVWTSDIMANRVELLHKQKPKSDYPNMGTSKSLSDISAEAEEGFNASESSDSKYDDLPF